MKDLVLEGFVNNFAEGRGLVELPQDEIFEAFATYSLLRNRHQCDVADLDDNLIVGGNADGGIDSIAILVNGRPVHTEDDVRFFAEHLQRLDVDFVFLQAKTSSHFKASDIGHFTFGVEQFFAAVSGEEPQIAFSSQIHGLIDIAKNIYSQSIRMRANPNCYLYFATTGTWQSDADPASRLSAGETALTATQMFSTVRAVPVDAETLKTIYREIERGVVKEIEFSRAATFPRIAGVDDAYIGLLPGREFIKLISNDGGELNRELFYDNVRDFQGNNPVNTEIGHTLSDEHGKYNFPLLNNGVTIVARDLRRTGDNFTISDFQVVNGCQTTHIFFQNKESIDADTFVPVKLVATQNQQVVTEVIKATNRQTAVHPEALESLTPFHKDLEDLYENQEAYRDYANRFHYERRSKQYINDNINHKNIVTLTAQIKSFIAMFLNEPHSHPRYYGELLRAYEGRIFAQDHNPEPYYASGVALLTVEQWINANAKYRDLRSYKHQILMLLRAAIGGREMPRFNSNTVGPYALGIAEVLRDPERGPEACRQAATHVRDVLKDFGARRGERNPPHRLRAFTERLLESVEARKPTATEDELGVAPPGNRSEAGIIRWFDEWKNYGFIGQESGDDIFVHGSKLEAIPWHRRIGGQRVEFRIAPDPKSRGMVMATDVRVAPE